MLSKDHRRRAKVVYDVLEGIFLEEIQKNKMKSFEKNIVRLGIPFCGIFGVSDKPLIF